MNVQEAKLLQLVTAGHAAMPSCLYQRREHDAQKERAVANTYDGRG
jgi:hypothetical protein